MKIMQSLLAAPLLGLALAAGAAGYEEGKHYTKVVPAQPTSVAPGEVEVIEFFWYGCPHCFQLEPLVESWSAGLPDKVKFRRVPAAFNPLWQLHAKAYYTAEQLGVLDRTHKTLFNAIHVERNMIDTQEELAEFFQDTAQVSPDEFRQAFNSFSVNARVQRADVLARRYRISGVPALVVNGKYLIEAGQAGSHQAMLDIADQLIARELGAPAASESGAQGE